VPCEGGGIDEVLEKNAVDQADHHPCGHLGIELRIDLAARLSFGNELREVPSDAEVRARSGEGAKVRLRRL